MALGEGVEDKDGCRTTAGWKNPETEKDPGIREKEYKRWETAAESTDEKWASGRVRGVLVCVLSVHRPSGASSMSWSLGDAPGKKRGRRRGDGPESEEGAFLGLEVRLD